MGTNGLGLGTFNGIVETAWAKEDAEKVVLKGIGSAPSRATTLPDGSAERKTYPIASGALDYFPDAIAEIAHVSYLGNEQHNPGQPLHWAREKSSDEADAMMRHFVMRGSLDTDGIRHTAKMAWRALAYLQKELEAKAERGNSPDDRYMS